MNKQLLKEKIKALKEEADKLDKESADYRMLLNVIEALTKNIKRVNNDKTI